MPHSHLFYQTWKTWILLLSQVRRPYTPYSCYYGLSPSTTPIKRDNGVTEIFTYNNIKTKHFKLLDMKLHLLFLGKTNKNSQFLGINAEIMALITFKKIILQPTKGNSRQNIICLLAWRLHISIITFRLWIYNYKRVLSGHKTHILTWLNSVIWFNICDSHITVWHTYVYYCKLASHSIDTNVEHK